MNTKLTVIRQGDLLFVPASADEYQKAEDGSDKQTKGIIREGEATGHHHRLADLSAGEVYRPTMGWNRPEAFVFVGENGATIVHEEHGPVELAPNTAYRVNVAREFNYVDAFAPRYVRD